MTPAVKLRDLTDALELPEDGGAWLDRQTGTVITLDGDTLRALDGEVRRFIQTGDCASLRTYDAGVYQSLKTIGPDGLKAVRTYIQANVSLDDLIRVA
jgi:hypothetical protein